MQEDNDQIKINTELQTCMNQVKDDIKYIKNRMEHLEDVFVTRKEFGPVQKLVYSFVGLTMATVVMAILYLVIKIK